METGFNSEMDSFDEPLPSAPMPRWQRKALEAANASDSVASQSNELAPSSISTAAHSSNSTTNRRSRLPNNDRFIPNRSAMDLDVSRHALFNDGKENGQDGTSYPSIVSASLLDQPPPVLGADGKLRPKNDLSHSKILTFSDKAPAVKEGYLNPNRVLFSQSVSGAGGRRHKFRHISQRPQKILDAPNLVDDFYLNLMDWGSSNVLAVALSDAVYLWNAQSGNIAEMCRLSTDSSFYTALKWSNDGNFISIASTWDDIQIWDVRTGRLLRTMHGHHSRVCSLAWNGHTLSSGARDGELFNHDVRIAAHRIASLVGHSQDVCGLSWNDDGRRLASGSNDNSVCIWDVHERNDQQWEPRMRLTEHSAAVKAVAWCPWQSNLLASGGGTADRHLRFWNSVTGTCVNSVDTKSQVCSIIWSLAEKELVTSHGFSQNQLTVWKYPSLVRMAELKGHQSRVLHTALSPDGQTVASLAGDETLRLWKVFPSANISGNAHDGDPHSGKGGLSSSAHNFNIR